VHGALPYLPHAQRRLPNTSAFALPEDGLIAAVAESNGLIVVTRNVRHFEPLGVRVLNPWAPAIHD
jgi:predicted nucleic acid-binding protein